jgi:hypothetical protein
MALKSTQIHNTEKERISSARKTELQKVENTPKK